MGKKIILTAVIGTLAYIGVKKNQATKENRSLRSKMLETGLRIKANKKNKTVVTNENEFKRAMSTSANGYILTEQTKQHYAFDYAKDFNNTLEYVPKGDNPEHVIFFLHGGSYWLEPENLHFAFLKKIAENTNSRILMPIYPKAPYFQAHDVYDFVIDNYKILLNQVNKTQESIIMMGDSAGGGLALGLMQVLKEKNEKLPKQAFLLAPWLDITKNNGDRYLYQADDVILNVDTLAFFGQVFAGRWGVNDPRVSPLFGDSSDLPPVYVFTGKYDILYTDALAFEKLADRQGWDVKVFKFDKMLHDFPIFPIPEGQQVLKLIYKIINTKER